MCKQQGHFTVSCHSAQGSTQWGGGGSTLLAQFCSPVLSEVSLELAMTLGYSLDIFIPKADDTALPCQENV